MIRKEGYLAGYIRNFAFVLLLFFSASFAQAASLYFSPSSLTRAAKETFSGTVRVSTNAQAINAAEGSIVFDPAKVEVVSISKSGSIFNLWTQEPIFSNAEGTVNFEGGVPNPGYTGTSGLIITISFRAKTATTVRGSTDITLISGAVLANDGLGTNILSSLGKLTLTISPTTDTAHLQPEITSDTSGIVAGAPKVESSTHPDPAKWYSNNNPTFTWTLPSSVTGVSYLITDKATSNPGPKSDGVVSKATFTGITDGTQYFNIKFSQGGTWGPISHFQFNIDTAPPVGFEIHAITGDDIQPQITFETTDALSGIDHYEIKVGDSGNWITVSADQAGKPYRLSFDRIGTQTVFVKAVDKAGNTTTESISLSITGTAIGSTVGTWIAKLFDSIVNALSAYGLLIALLAAIIGTLILIFKFLGASIDKLWHKWDNRRIIRKTERKADSTLDKLMDEMSDEIKFLNTIGKHRRLSTDEKYLKSKIEQYLKALKNNGR